MFRRITRSGDNPPVRKPYKVQFDTFEKELDAVRPVLIDSTLPTLIIKNNLHSKDELHKMRRRELIKEYGGNVVLLKPGEEVINNKDNTELFNQVAKEFIEYVEKRRYEDSWDHKKLIDTPYYQRLKMLISTK